MSNIGEYPVLVAHPASTGLPNPCRHLAVCTSSSTDFVVWRWPLQAALHRAAST